MATDVLNNCPAPAKLNLFLHVTGRRADGYHELQTVFQLLDRGDVLHFRLREDGEIRRVSDLPGVPAENDLVVRAARLLQSHAGCAQGVDIAVEKHLPMGGGLGGGSSDAATTLLALNHLWRTGLSRTELMQLGLRLGADVPFFVFGQNAFAEGVGEALVAVATPDCWYVVVEPGVETPTAQIFSDPHLTRDTKAVRISDFSGASVGFGKNDLQAVATRLFAPISEALGWLGQFGQARMTGSGACVFCAFAKEQDADAVLEAARVTGKPAWKVWKAKAIERHPLSHLLQS
ncbi:MAG TPA: 4-(cytidine 5'-diphospho)-2-C-methyl-D-erythritol kinase [Noviherbaspirillum sp.]|nr:4-(cytidine 5'-diphospho)-2-C-methyl-D-erythritol kinase [Noviherbaspirillum sp.]